MWHNAGNHGCQQNILRSDCWHPNEDKAYKKVSTHPDLIYFWVIFGPVSSSPHFLEQQKARGRCWDGTGFSHLICEAP